MFQFIIKNKKKTVLQTSKSVKGRVEQQQQKKALLGEHEK